MDETYTELDSEFGEVEEEQTEQTAWYKNLEPKRIAIFGLVLVLVLHLIMKVNPYVTMAVGIATFMFVIFLSSQKDTARKYIDCYTATSIVHNDLQKKKEFVKDLKKEKWEFTNINFLREFQGEPWRWYINFVLTNNLGQKEFWFAIVDPWTATMKGYQKLNGQVDVDKFKVNTIVHIPFASKMDIAIKKDMPPGAVGKW